MDMTNTAELKMRPVAHLKVPPMRILPPHWIQVTNTRDRAHVPSDPRILSLEQHPEPHPERNLCIQSLVIFC